MGPHHTASSSSSASSKNEDLPGHSQGLSKFLSELSGAYNSNDKNAITKSQLSILSALRTEKKIKKKRVEVKKDVQFVEALKRLGFADEKKNDEKKNEEKDNEKKN